MILLTSLYNFNSHPRVGGDDGQTLFHACALDFNSHPRVGGDLRDKVSSLEMDISTHTPAWGVTYFVPPKKYFYENFNSHPRVGGDRLMPILPPMLAISTHTPAWGVTRCRLHPPHLKKFQLTPPRGG